jgi:hypothetical protein
MSLRPVASPPDREGLPSDAARWWRSPSPSGAPGLTGRAAGLTSAPQPDPGRGARPQPRGRRTRVSTGPGDPAPTPRWGRRRPGPEHRPGSRACAGGPGGGVVELRCPMWTEPRCPFGTPARSAGFTARRRGWGRVRFLAPARWLRGARRTGGQDSAWPDDAFGGGGADHPCLSRRRILDRLAQQGFRPGRPPRPVRRGRGDPSHGLWRSAGTNRPGEVGPVRHPAVIAGPLRYAAMADGDPDVATIRPSSSRRTCTASRSRWTRAWASR